MKTLVILACLVGSACGDNVSEATLRLEALRKKVCACPDQACAAMVYAEYQQVPKAESTTSKDEAERVVNAVNGFFACKHKLEGREGTR